MKKSIAFVLLCVFVLTFICSCADKEKINESSVTASIESSTIETSSVNTESENSSSEKSSSSKKSSSNKTSSSSNSQSVKVSSNERLDVMMCGFAPGVADYYGDKREDGIREMEDVIKEGYVNALSLSPKNMQHADVWELAVKYDLSIWCSAWDVFNSKKESLAQYAKVLDDTVKFAKQNPEWYRRFKGFWYDEKVWRRETNADFLAETKYVYQKYGKRTYAVLATGEFSAIEGNATATDENVANDSRKMITSSFKYITDVGFDSYGTDVRDGAGNNNIANRFKDTMPEIVDGKTYYQQYTKRLLNLVGHPVNLWYIPCAYIRTISGGVDGEKWSSEDYCLAHLNFFNEELKKQQYAGGLMLYVYSLSEKSESEGKKGLQHYFVVRDAEGNDKIHPETDNKWEDYSARLKKIVSEYNSKKVKFTLV